MSPARDIGQSLTLAQNIRTPTENRYGLARNAASDVFKALHNSLDDTVDSQDAHITLEQSVLTPANNRETVPLEVFTLHFYAFAMQGDTDAPKI